MVRKSVIAAAAVIVTVIAAGSQQSLLGQQGGNAQAGAQGQGRGGGAAAANLPAQPTAVTLPRFEKITGPGPAFNSSPAQWPGRDMNFYRYVADEYFVSGTANGIASAGWKRSSKSPASGTSSTRWSRCSRRWPKPPPS